jgi:centrin-3
MSLYDTLYIGLSLDDFLPFIVEKLSNRDLSDSLQISFNCFDKDAKGFIVMSDLKRVCKEINETVSDEDLDMMMAHIDKDGGGSVTVDEWITVMAETF